MGVPKKRTSKSRRDMRRGGNKNLRTAVQVNACPKCKEPVMPHRACTACGFYREREVLKVD